MELNENEEKAVKTIYSQYHADELTADDALGLLEVMLNGGEICPLCLSTITDENPLIDATRYSVGDNIGYCDNCYDPTPLY